MRRKWSRAERGEPREGSALQRRRRIAADLELRGVSAAVAEPLAERLAALCPKLDAEEYAAALSGAAAVFDVVREGFQSLEHSSRDIDEIQRLMQGFAGELRKLEEGLRIVSAYVLRMHSKATKERGGVLH